MPEGIRITHTIKLFTDTERTVAVTFICDICIYLIIVPVSYTHLDVYKRQGEIENPSGVGTVGNAKCGDIMRMYLDIECVSERPQPEPPHGRPPELRISQLFI